jgi:hypothetical protein
MPATQAPNLRSFFRALRSAARPATLIAAALALASAGLALSQTPIGQADESVQANAVTAPVAHVYVTNSSHVYAFSAAANGKLTPVPGSPFSDSLAWMGANGHYLFGFKPSSVTIESFSMAANGALHKVATTNTATYDPDESSCPLTYWNGQGFKIDHSGLDLYNAAIPEDLYCSSVFQSFKIDDANGKLTYLGETGKIFFGGPQLAILGNNKYAYSPNCVYPFGNNGSPEIAVFERLSSGKLATSTAGVAIPAAPIDASDPNGPSSGYYCPITMATDPTNHAAMTFFALNYDDGVNYGPVVIATYTADTKGNLTTTSTYKNMAVSETSSASLSNASPMRMSPSGKLLAIGGSGLEIFHFNGGAPATKYKLLLTGDSISQIFWDNNNHMYAIGTTSANAGKLWVYTVTPTSVTEAPGSPYAIQNAAYLAVQPL